MSRYHNKNTDKNNQDNMSPLDPSNVIRVGPKICNVTQDKVYKMALMNILEILKDKMN